MLASCMGQLIQLQELHQARRRRSEKVSMDQCVELLEWNLKKSIDDYFAAPRDERSMRATQIRKLSEILEYALRVL
jgi:myo-inositol catabolism protein IolC